MTLAPGARLGPYEVLASIGRGGMGEVFRARDTRLDRIVAIKVVLGEVAADPGRRQRFEREARLISQLNHPNICTLYDVGQEGGVDYLVVEYLEGQTLAERIQKEALPVEQALPLAIQIADALSAAHRKAIVHRDLKPANVMLTASGAKLLDFGIAKVLAPAAVGAAESGDTASTLTVAGTIVGTVAYMAPEQLEARDADARSDIFAFGCVLFEMLTGRRAFEGETQATVIAAVLDRDPPPVSTLQPFTSPAVDRVVTKCLTKDPDRRWQTAADLKDELQWIAGSGAAPTALAPTMPSPVPVWKRAVPIVATAVVVAAIAGAGGWQTRTPPQGLVSKFSILLPEDQQFTGTARNVIAISPDGTLVVYAASNQLFLRSMADLSARPIPGAASTTNINSPAFSPDGQWIVYWDGSDATLKKIPLTGGVALTLCKAANPFGLGWDRAGIVFGQGSEGVLLVSPNGGEPKVIAAAQPGETADSPQVLGDGTAVLFSVTKGTGPERWDKADVVVQSLQTQERTVVFRGGSAARYLPTGHLAYAVGGTLYAMPFDLGTLQATGGAVPILKGVTRSAALSGIANFAYSSAGTLIFVPGGSGKVTARALALIDRNGQVRKLPLPPGPYHFPRLSPDGRRVAMTIGDDVGKENDVWVYDLAAAAPPRRLTFGGRNSFPIWTPDGRAITFQSDREGDLGLFQQRADGSGSAERLTRSDPKSSHVPEAWSPDGKVLSFNVRVTAGARLWTLQLTGDRLPQPLSQPGAGRHGCSSFSPDGRWLAYASDEVSAGTFRVYVQPVPPTGAKYQVTTAAGTCPAWTRDGQQLVYGRYATRLLFATDVRTTPSFSTGQPVLIRADAMEQSTNIIDRQFDVMPDGKQFLVVLPSASAGDDGAGSYSDQINVVFNWFEELKRLVPAS